MAAQLPTTVETFLHSVTEDKASDPLLEVVNRPPQSDASFFLNRVSSHFYGYGCNPILGIASSIDLNSYQHSATPKLIS